MPNLRRSNTLSRRAMALGLGLAGLAAACNQPGATAAPTDAMMEHSPAPTDAMMEHSATP